MKIAIAERFDSIKTIGGFGKFDADDGETEIVGEVFAEKPFQRGLRLANLQNSNQLSLPEWTNSGTSSGFLNLNMEKFTNAFSTVFETIVADGEEGIFEAVLEDLKNDPNGPRIDIDRQIIRCLGSPAFFCSTSDGKQPATLVGIPLNDHDSVVSALTRFYNGDKNAKRLKSKLVAWNVEPLESIKTESSQPYVVAISDEYLFICPDISMAENAVRTGSAPVRLDDELPDQNQTGEYCFGYRLNLMKHVHYRYQQLLSGNLNGSLGRLLEQSIGNSKQPAIRVEELPPFSEVADYFSSRLTIVGKSNQSGWSITGKISN